MFKFFRRIRQGLLAENKFSKYLLYALGEIILVVIGILIALQINNWNEASKQDRVIREVLSEIREDLLQDQIELTRALYQNRIDYKAQQRIIEVLETKAPYDENVRSDLGRIHLARTVFSANKGYDLLKELNLGTLKDKELRILLTQYYERDIPMVYREYEDDRLEFEAFWLPYARAHFSEWELGSYAVPIDYEQILYDQRLLTATKMNLNNHQNTIEAYERALNTVAVLIEQLPEAPITIDP